jgi:hypothetical protein
MKNRHVWNDTIDAVGFEGDRAVCRVDGGGSWMQEGVRVRMQKCELQSHARCCDGA